MFLLHFRLKSFFDFRCIKLLSREIVYTGAAQRDVRLASLRKQGTVSVFVKGSLHRLDMSRLKYVSLGKNYYGLSGFKVIYDGRELLSLASKHEAETFITKYLRSIGKIGMTEQPPVKARYRPQRRKKSKICGIIWTPQSSMYVGSNYDMGSHTTLESAKAALDKKNTVLYGRNEKLGSVICALVTFRNFEVQLLHLNPNLAQKC